MCAQVTLKEDGFKGLAKGWAPTFLGYAAQVSQIQNNFSFLYMTITGNTSHQGMCKFGLYEVFKVHYSEMIGEENAYVYRTALYLAASASAEFFADIALSPMESAKVSYVILIKLK